MLLFARSPAAEAAAKRIRDAGPLFALTLRRVRAAAAEVDAELVVVADGWWMPSAGASFLAQRGADFGERLGNAFADVRALGFDHVVSVGIDSPGIRAGHLQDAFDALDRVPMVLGPAADGGAYLIGCSAATERHLGSVRWLGPHVLADLLSACPEAVLLPDVLTDLDRSRDAFLLASAAADDPELAQLLAGRSAPASSPSPRRPDGRPVGGTERLTRRGPPQLAAA